MYINSIRNVQYVHIGLIKKITPNLLELSKVSFFWRRELKSVKHSDCTTSTSPGTTLREYYIPFTSSTSACSTYLSFTLAHCLPNPLLKHNHHHSKQCHDKTVTSISKHDSKQKWECDDGIECWEEVDGGGRRRMEERKRRKRSNSREEEEEEEKRKKKVRKVEEEEEEKEEEEEEEEEEENES